MKDFVVVGALVFSFALLVTAHVVLVWGLAFHKPRWRALVAFFVPILAPYFGLKEKMRVRSVLWIISAIVYAVAFFLAR